MPGTARDAVAEAHPGGTTGRVRICPLQVGMRRNARRGPRFLNTASARASGRAARMSAGRGRGRGAGRRGPGRRGRGRCRGRGSRDHLVTAAGLAVAHIGRLGVDLLGHHGKAVVDRAGHPPPRGVPTDIVLGAHHGLVTRAEGARLGPSDEGRHVGNVAGRGLSRGGNHHPLARHHVASERRGAAPYPHGAGMGWARVRVLIRVIAGMVTGRGASHGV